MRPGPTSVRNPSFRNGNLFQQETRFLDQKIATHLIEGRLYGVANLDMLTFPFCTASWRLIYKCSVSLSGNFSMRTPYEGIKTSISNPGGNSYTDFAHSIIPSKIRLLASASIPKLRFLLMYFCNGKAVK